MTLWHGLLILLVAAASFINTVSSLEMPETSSTRKESNMMNAIVYEQGANALKLVSRTPPKAGRQGRVLVQVNYAGLNPVDAKDVMGDKLPHDWQWAQGQLRNHIRGNIVGFDFAGVVQETTADQRFQTGDKVFGNMPPMEGTLAEYISVPLDQICHAPANLSLKHVAAFPLVGLTAVQSLSPCVREGKSVLVVGASGGAGHVGLQAARNLGASHVTAVCSSRNENFVKKFGATHFVDYTLNDSDPDTLYDNLKNAPGNPYHVVLDCVTSEDPRDRVIDYPDLIRRGGKARKSPLVTEDHTYLRLGGPSPDWVRAALEKAGLPWWPDKHEKLFWIRFPKSSGELKQLQEWAQDGKLDVQVSRTVPFTAEDVKGAFDQILERRVQGKMVVEVMAEE